MKASNKANHNLAMQKAHYTGQAYAALWLPVLAALCEKRKIPVDDMIYARFTHNANYEEFHSELDQYIRLKYKNVQSGLQCDSWIWVTEDDDKVEIDTFYSHKHEVKSPNKNSILARRVIEYIHKKYELGKV